MNENTTEAAVVIIKRKKGAAHDDHHGGAWKIAYADFVTAMMAFFLLMWLLGSTSKGDLNGIAEYFNTPLSVAITGGSRSGTANSVLDGGAMSLLKTVPAAANVSPKSSQDKSTQQANRVKQLDEDVKRLTELKSKIESLINLNPKLSPFKNQIKLDMTSEGLRIQIIDAQNRPMFDSGSSTLESYTKDILDQLGVVLNDVENHVSIAGHTDSLAYTGGANGYSNWELSSERANAARRELINGGMTAQKVLQVRGLSDALPLDPTDPSAPGNRRISIVVLNKQTEEAFFRDGGRTDIANVSQVASAVAASTARPIAASGSK
ncbi:flagellar motor protein MotB [Burkholderia sp. L27(2015)]|uniref:flagellar motor protein MotB n=1 Tax=Burkholderia sp. L27(2015) TaxID=1641858 RepID=UPI00131E6F91|nr:flagellar motor protein MotB [Burkholderia sp. L27(2015)]